MNRNSEIQKIFEIADDSLQGVLGYHFYTCAMQNSVNEKKVWDNLPDDVIPHTVSWDRYYQKKDLTDTLAKIFEWYYSRISLIAMINVFEAALSDFISHLEKERYPQTLDGKPEKYKTHLKWAYSQAKECDIGDKEAIRRLPITFGRIDNARRLRNLIIHNHGLFTKRYKEDAIDKGIKIELHPDYAEFEKNPEIPCPIKITTNDIIIFSRSHIEVLLVLHNTIQKKFFKFPESYDYRNEQKSIEWEKVLWGDND